MRILLFLLLSTTAYSQTIGEKNPRYEIIPPTHMYSKTFTFKGELSLDSVLQSPIKPKFRSKMHEHYEIWPISGVDSVNFWPSTFPLTDTLNTHRLDSIFSIVSKPNYSLVKFGVKSGVLDTFNFWPVTSCCPETLEPMDTIKPKEITFGQLYLSDPYEGVYLLLYDVSKEAIIVRKGYVNLRSPGRSFHLEKDKPLPSNYKLITFFD